MLKNKQAIQAYTYYQLFHLTVCFPHVMLSLKQKEKQKQSNIFKGIMTITRAFISSIERLNNALLRISVDLDCESLTQFERIICFVQD